MPVRDHPCRIRVEPVETEENREKLDAYNAMQRARHKRNEAIRREREAKQLRGEW